VPPAFVCLAAARRPADVPSEGGWLAAEAWDPPLHLVGGAALLEDRFGARLLQIGPGAEIRLLVSRPPWAALAALAVAAELWAARRERLLATRCAADKHGSTPDFGTASRRCARGVPECAPPRARG
jgi:hypothetical protein